MKNILPCLLLFITTTLSAQNMNQGGPAKSDFYQAIPYRQINGKIIIDVELAGRIHHFLLDTGAPCMLSDEVVTQLKLTAVNKSKMIDANGNTAKTGIITLPPIKLGDVTFNNIPALVSLPTLLKCFGIDGVIGSNLFRNTILRFDGQKKVIIITDDATKLALNGDNSIPLDVTDNQSNPRFGVAFGQTNKIFVFDSGDSGFLSLSGNYMADLQKQNTFNVLSKGYGANSFGQNGAENYDTKYRLKFKALQIAGATFTNVITETQVNSAGTGDRIGVKLLEYGTLTLDYLHSKLYYTPTTPQTDLNEKTWQLSPMYNNGQLVTGIVWDKLKNTIKPGTQITAIDGVSYQQADLCNIITQKGILQGKEHVVLTLKDNKGKVSTLEIVKEF